MSEIQNPRQVGKRVLIRTVTHYHVGDIANILQLEDGTVTDILLHPAVWVADTGRFYTALKNGELREYEPFVHPALVSNAAIVDITEWPFPLPTEPKG